MMEKTGKNAKGSRRPITLKKFLVPIDFSECSQAALELACDLAQQFHAAVVLLHVVEPPLHPDNPLAMVEGQELGESRLNEARERLKREYQPRAEGAASAEVLVRMGHAHSEICDTAQALGVDLIVIGTHGYTGLKHVLLGSVAERVVRHSHCPVLTTRCPASPFRPGNP